MASVGAPELLVILVLALIVLGPDRLPQAARTLGKWVGQLRRLTGSFQDEVRDVVDGVMRPVTDTASVASDAFTSTFSSTSAAVDAPSSQPSGEATTETVLPADVPLPSLEVARALPVPPADPSLN